MEHIVYVLMAWLPAFFGAIIDYEGSDPLTQPDYKLQVTYEMHLNFDGLKKYHADLFSGPTNALFVYRLDHEFTDSKLFSSDSLDSRYHFDLLDTMRYSILSDRQNQTILQLEQLPEQQNFCIVQEELASIEWYFTGQSKSLQGFTCLEAYGQFAGRKYTIWFTDSISSYFGPWKLHGLPGLVLEAYDESREVNFYAKKIKSRSVDEKPPYNPMQAGSFIVMKRDAYSQIMQQFIEKITKRVMTKFGRGYEVNIQSSPFKTIEIYDQ